MKKLKFNNTPIVRKVEKPWGHEIIFTEDHFLYTGKILHIKAGQQLSLQFHDRKHETQFLAKGRCFRIADSEEGELVEIEMEQQKGYPIHIGQRHRLKAIEDCDIFEVSTPEIGNTFRLKDDYDRSTETEKIRKQKNRGWKRRSHA